MGNKRGGPVMVQLSAWRQISVRGRRSPKKPVSWGKKDWGWGRPEWFWFEEQSSGKKGLMLRVMQRKSSINLLSGPLKCWLNANLWCMCRVQFHEGNISGEGIHWEAVSRRIFWAHPGLENIWVLYSQSRKISLYAVLIENPKGSCLNGAKLVLK